MKPAKDKPTPRDLPPVFIAAVKKVLAYQPRNEKRRSRISAKRPNCGNCLAAS